MRGKFLAGEFLARRLPFAPCPTCGVAFWAGSLGHLPPHVLSTLPASDARLSRTEFFALSEDLRRLLGLDESFPIEPGARVVPLTLRWRVKAVPNVVISSAGDTLVVATEKTAARAVEAGMTGVVWLPVVNDRKSKCQEPLTEMVVVGAGTHSLTDDEVAMCIADDFEEYENMADFARCPTCHEVPYHLAYANGRPLTSRYDAFRMRDFNGIYVSERFKDFLVAASDGVLAFDPAG